MSCLNHLISLYSLNQLEKATNQLLMKYLIGPIFSSLSQLNISKRWLKQKIAKLQAYRCLLNTKCLNLNG